MVWLPMASCTWSLPRTCKTSAVITCPACSTIPLAGLLGADAAADWIFDVIVMAMIHRDKRKPRLAPCRKPAVNRDSSSDASATLTQLFKSGCDRVEIDQFSRPSCRHFVVHAPFLGVPVLIDMGRGPDLIRLDHAMEQRERQQRRSSQARDHMQRRDHPGIGGQRPARGGNGSVGLAGTHPPLRPDEVRA